MVFLILTFLLKYSRSMALLQSFSSGAWYGVLKKCQNRNYVWFRAKAHQQSSSVPATVIVNVFKTPYCSLVPKQKRDFKGIPFDKNIQAILLKYHERLLLFNRAIADVQVVHTVG
jgi:hypothetical protein